MKLNKIFLIGAIALGMVACSNEEKVDLTGQPESTISVRVVPGTDGIMVRSIGDISGNGVSQAGLAAESAIKQLEVWVFAGETPAGYGSVSGADVTQVLNIATTSGGRTIVVAANAGIGPAVSGKAELLAKTKDIPVTIANGLPMTSDAIDVTLNPGKNQYGFSSTTPGYDGTTGVQQLSVGVPLKVVRVNARVAIVGATLALEAADEALFDNLKDVQVAMFNVPKTSKLFGAPLSLAKNADYLFGSAWTSTAGTYTIGTANANFLDSPVTFPIVNTTAPYYYVNENTATDAKGQMFIVVRGKTYKGTTQVIADGYFTDAEGYTYYPVWINALKAGYSYTTGYTADSKISRNTQYNITLTIKHKGNPNIDPPSAAQLDVQVAVAPWAVVGQAVEW